MNPLFSSHGATAPSGPGNPHYRGFTITLSYTTLGRTPLDEWSARRRDLYLRTHNTHKTDIHDPCGIRTRSPSKWAAADPRLRQRGHCDRLGIHLVRNNLTKMKVTAAVWSKLLLFPASCRTLLTKSLTSAHEISCCGLHVYKRFS
jgi:hypothetical protein